MIIFLIVAAVVVLTTIGGAVYVVRKKKYEEMYEDWEREYCLKGSPTRISTKQPKASETKRLLEKRNNKSNLDWFQRFWILRGVASGLFYLHEECEQVVLHRDIKPANVLLDANLNGKLGDFGLARLHDHGSNPQTTKLVGTIGYIAPELLKTGKASTSTDV
ncbi:hypothetical protein JRO89_XSUnG0018500 [Xanthoceras sorbifolium]|uniref:Protein kinase domain-containing protein n=1 Tax=Xanthoceras sorbifolium TaxID=99658 RepID=A0ABQ8H0A4_9ROSI|nr:hypothetical protein JRO89_XSUnG0018500 [Xanthoceras sorbifolium]